MNSKSGKFRITTEQAQALRRISDGIDKKNDNNQKDIPLDFSVKFDKKNFSEAVNSAVGNDSLTKEAELLFNILDKNNNHELDTDESSILKNNPQEKTTNSSSVSRNIKKMLLENNSKLEINGKGEYVYNSANLRKESAEDVVESLKNAKTHTLPKGEQENILKDYLGLDSDKNQAGDKDAFYKIKRMQGKYHVSEFYRVVEDDKGQRKIIHTIMTENDKGEYDAETEVFDLITPTPEPAPVSAQTSDTTPAPVLETVTPAPAAPEKTEPVTTETVTPAPEVPEKTKHVTPEPQPNRPEELNANIKQYIQDKNTNGLKQLLIQDTTDDEFMLILNDKQYFPKSIQILVKDWEDKESIMNDVTSRLGKIAKENDLLKKSAIDLLRLFHTTKKYL